MTIVTGTFTSFAAIGNREDLADQIYNISPKETPFMANVASNKATATLHEWQTDALATAAANAQLEGDDYTYATPAATTRAVNTCQISNKTVIVSRTQDAINKAGRKSEYLYQIMKKANELKRDMEVVLTGNTARVTGNTTTARVMRNLCPWYTTNVSRGSGGSSGGTSTAATDGTQRPLNESLMKAMIQSAWTNGGTPDLILCGPFNKQVISAFAGNVTRMQDTTDKKLDTSISVYVSDFGEHKIVADRFSRDRDLHILTSNLWAVSYLRPMQTYDLAQTGSANKGAVEVEYVLEARNEAGSAVVADLTTS